jgi:hypothetical protein
MVAELDGVKARVCIYDLRGTKIVSAFERGSGREVYGMGATANAAYMDFTHELRRLGGRIVSMELHDPAILCW